MQALSRDEAAVLAGEEDEARCHFAWLTGTAHGRSKRFLRVFVHGRRNKWCPDYQLVSKCSQLKPTMTWVDITWTRANTIDTNTVRHLLV